MLFSSELGEVVTYSFSCCLVCGRDNSWTILVVRYFSLVKPIKSQILVSIPQTDPDNNALFLKSGENILYYHLLWTVIYHTSIHDNKKAPAEWHEAQYRQNHGWEPLTEHIKCVIHYCCCEQFKNLNFYFKPENYLGFLESDYASWKIQINWI